MMLGAMSDQSMNMAKMGQIPLSGEAESEVITSRFGSVKIDRKNPIFFPRGLLGMPDKFHFCLTQFPNDKMNRQFKLLQSVDDHNLSFIVLPLELQNNIVDEEDIKEAARELDIPLEHLGTVLIVSVHRSPQAVRISVNARAPVFMHAENRLAVQHVFQNDKYKVQRMISI